MLAPRRNGLSLLPAPSVPFAPRRRTVGFPETFLPTHMSSQPPQAPHLLLTRLSQRLSHRILDIHLLVPPEVHRERELLVLLPYLLPAFSQLQSFALNIASACQKTSSVKMFTEVIWKFSIWFSGPHVARSVSSNGSHLQVWVLPAPHAWG